MEVELIVFLQKQTNFINEKQKDFEFVARISMRHAVNYLSSAPQGRFFLRGSEGATFD